MSIFAHTKPNKIMKALVKKYPKRGIWMEDVPVPKIGVNDVLIKIKRRPSAAANLHIYKWDDFSQKTTPTPLTIGHEYVGTIVEMGAGVRNCRVGDRVTRRRAHCLWALPQLPPWQTACLRKFDKRWRNARWRFCRISLSARKQCGKTRRHHSRRCSRHYGPLWQRHTPLWLFQYLAKMC